MIIANIVEDSIIEGPGRRFVVHVQGCPHNCLGCYNPELQDHWCGHEVRIEELVNKLTDTCVNGITLSGGEPFDQALDCAKFVIECKHIHPDFDVWVYTGYTYEEIINSNNYLWNLLLDVTDVLVDGPFIMEKKSVKRYIKSDNQRLINVHASKQANKIVRYVIR